MNIVELQRLAQEGDLRNFMMGAHECTWIDPWLGFFTTVQLEQMEPKGMRAMFMVNDFPINTVVCPLNDLSSK